MNASAINTALETAASTPFDVAYLNTPWTKLTLEELAALPLSTLTKEDSTLYMWCDSASAAAAAALLQGWGFKFAAVTAILNLAEKKVVSDAAPKKKVEDQKPQEEELEETAGAAPAAAVAKRSRAKVIHPPSWWPKDEGAVAPSIVRSTTEQLWMAVRGAGAAMAPKFKREPFQVQTLTSFAKKAGRHSAAWCPEDVFVTRPSNFLNLVASAYPSDARILELFGDAVHDNIHGISPGLPGMHVPAIGSTEGTIGLLKSVIAKDGKVALKSLATKLRKAPEEGKELDACVPSFYARVAEAGVPAAAEPVDFSSPLHLLMLWVIEHKVRTQKPRAKKVKRKVNPDAPARPPAGITKAGPVSDAMCAFLGLEAGSLVPRTTITGAINAYIKEKQLRSNPANKKNVVMDEKLGALFGLAVGTEIDSFPMSKCIAAHIYPHPKKAESETAAATAEPAAEVEAEQTLESPSKRARTE